MRTRTRARTPLTVASKFRLRMWTSVLSFMTKLLQQPVKISLTSIHGLGLFPFGTHVWYDAAGGGIKHKLLMAGPDNKVQ